MVRADSELIDAVRLEIQSRVMPATRSCMR